MQILARGHSEDKLLESPRKKLKVAQAISNGLMPDGTFPLASFDFDEHLADECMGAFESEVRRSLVHRGGGRGPQLPPCAGSPSPTKSVAARQRPSPRPPHQLPWHFPLLPLPPLPPHHHQPDHAELHGLLLPGEMESLQQNARLKPTVISLSPRGEGRRQAARLQRCGKCGPCKAIDCGTCQNCADKPRFGGKGVKKQACVVRRCINLTKHEDDAAELPTPLPTPPAPMPPLAPAPMHPPMPHQSRPVPVVVTQPSSALPVAVATSQVMRTPSPDSMSSEEMMSHGTGSPTGVMDGPSRQGLPRVTAAPVPFNGDKSQLPMAEAQAAPAGWGTADGWGGLAPPTWEEPNAHHHPGPGMLQSCEFDLARVDPAEGSLKLDEWPSWLSEGSTVTPMA